MNNLRSAGCARTTSSAHGPLEIATRCLAGNKWHAPSRKQAAKATDKLMCRVKNALAEADAWDAAGNASRSRRARRKAEHLSRKIGSSLSGKLIALAQACRKRRFRNDAPTGETFVDQAASLSLTRPGTEDITIRAVDKKGWEEFRTIFSFGLYETARQILASMCLKQLLPVQPNQYLTQNGGRSAAARRIRQLLAHPDMKFVVTLDLKNFFPSVDQEWLKATLPMGHKVSTHVLCVENHHRRATCKGYGLYRHALHSSTILTASQHGIPQGAVPSPMIADFIISTVLSTIANMPPGVEIVNFADDFVMFARGRRELEAAVHTLQDAFGRHRAGKLLLLSDGIRRVCDGVDFLGYRLRRRRGEIAIEPTVENEQKFARKFDRLIARHVLGVDAYEKRLFRYLRTWRSAFQEWKAGDCYILSKLRRYDQEMPDARLAIQGAYRKLLERHRQEVLSMFSDLQPVATGEEIAH